MVLNTILEVDWPWALSGPGSGCVNNKGLGLRLWVEVQDWELSLGIWQIAGFQSHPLGGLTQGPRQLIL